MKKWHGGKIWGWAWVWQPEWEVRQKALSKFSVVIRVRSMDLSTGKSRQLRDVIREEEARGVDFRSEGVPRDFRRRRPRMSGCFFSAMEYKGGGPRHHGGKGKSCE